MKLKDKVAVITGANSGIGRGIALDMALVEGAKVIVVDIRPVPKVGKFFETESRNPTAEEIISQGGTAEFFQADISKEEEIKNLVNFVLERFGKTDIIVNNAGYGIPGNTQKLSLKDWETVIGVNLKGPFLMTKYFAPLLKKSSSGRILNFSSVHAFGGGGGPAYPPAKAGLVNLTKDSALEFARDGITVNCICPGFIETPIQDYLTKEIIEGALESTPIPRLGLPKDIAKICSFLASSDASWITGIAIPVDGGREAQLFMPESPRYQRIINKKK